MEVVDNLDPILRLLTIPRTGQTCTQKIPRLEVSLVLIVSAGNMTSRWLIASVMNSISEALRVRSRVPAHRRSWLFILPSELSTQEIASLRSLLGPALCSHLLRPPRCGLLFRMTVAVGLSMPPPLAMLEAKRSMPFWSSLWPMRSRKVMPSALFSVARLSTSTEELRI